MNPSRTLTLKPEALQELTAGELDAVAGAAQQQTQYSCLHYVSCFWYQCIPTLNGCDG